jgi:hypothetical protein
MHGHGSSAQAGLEESARRILNLSAGWTCDFRSAPAESLAHALPESAIVDWQHRESIVEG